MWGRTVPRVFWDYNLKPFYALRSWDSCSSGSKTQPGEGQQRIELLLMFSDCIQLSVNFILTWITFSILRYSYFDSEREQHIFFPVFFPEILGKILPLMWTLPQNVIISANAPAIWKSAIKNYWLSPLSASFHIARCWSLIRTCCKLWDPFISFLSITTFIELLCLQLQSDRF